MCRLGRKLEPTISKRIFPLANIGHVSGKTTVEGPQLVTVTESPWSQLALFELSLDLGLYEHAALMLTLACDMIGGADSKGSTGKCSVV